MGIRTRRARKHSKTHAVALSIAGIFGFIALLLIALAISGTQLVNSWLQDLPDYTSAGAYLSSEPTEIYDANNTLIAEFYQQNRRNIDENQISPYVLKGIVDTEDIRFYQHNGVDPQGILRAVAVQLGGGSEGGSTITSSWSETRSSPMSSSTTHCAVRSVRPISQSRWKSSTRRIRSSRCI